MRWSRAYARSRASYRRAAFWRRTSVLVAGRRAHRMSFIPVLSAQRRGKVNGNAVVTMIPLIFMVGEICKWAGVIAEKVSDKNSGKRRLDR